MRAAIAATALVLACQRGPAGTAAPADAGHAPPAKGAVGVQVALPDEWSFFAAADGSLRAGPRGRTVLRIDPAPPGAPLATPDQLFNGFEAGHSGLSARVTKTEQTSDFSGVQIALVHERGGKGVQHRAFLGAKRLEGRVFLCASAAGSSTAEVNEATEVCRGLSARERSPTQ